MKFKCLLIVGILLSLVGSAMAQDLEVRSYSARAYLSKQVVTTSRIETQDGEFIAEVVTTGEPADAGSVGKNLIEVVSAAANVTVYASDINRRPVEVAMLPESTNRPRLYTLVDAKGKVWVRVSVIDFGLQLFNEQTIVVDAGGTVDPVIPPDPIPPNPIIDPPDSEVDDTYGVGAVSAKLAPDDLATRAIVAGQYRQAANFLFGDPTLKTINNANGNTPENNVFQWLAKAANEMDCPDLETCKKWAEWRGAVAQALNATQDTRQMTRQDWFLALNEVANAIGGAK